MIIWLLGISGSGKSTLGTLLKKRLDEVKATAFMIDGNSTRNFFDHDLGYSKQDRTANIKRILFGAHLLSQTGSIVIVSNISPFQELRDFARKKLKDYNEIYLHKQLSQSVKSDVNKIYHENLGKTELVGVQIPFEEPIHCDLRIDVDRFNVEESIEKLNVLLRAKYSDWPL